MEKRKHRRIRFERPVILRLFTGQRETLLAYDLSIKGIGLSSELPYNLNEVIALLFEIQHQGKARQVDVLGKIRHVQSTNTGYNLGIEFVSK